MISVVLPLVQRGSIDYCVALLCQKIGLICLIVVTNAITNMLDGLVDALYGSHCSHTRGRRKNIWWMVTNSIDGICHSCRSHETLSLFRYRLSQYFCEPPEPAEFSAARAHDALASFCPIISLETARC